MRLIVAATAAGAVLFGLAPSAQPAGPPLTATGSFTLGENITGSRTAGTNLFLTEVSPGTTSGDGIGSFVD